MIRGIKAADRPGLMSEAGRRIMARSELESGRLERFVNGLTKDERRAFWLGALLRDGAITITDVVRPAAQPPAVQSPKLRSLSPVRPAICWACLEPIEQSGQGRPRMWHPRCIDRRSRAWGVANLLVLFGGGQPGGAK